MTTVVALLLALALVTLHVYLSRRPFRPRVSAEVHNLFSASTAGVGPMQLSARWETLPEPVCRYLRYAISEGAPEIRTARLRHEGFMRTGPNARWMPVCGEEQFTVARAGFVWNAWIRPIPPVWIEGRDSYLADQGEMLVRLYSRFTIAHARGPQTDQASKLRWLAECV